MTPRRAADPRPVLMASLVAAVSLTALLLAAQHGWLGADVQRGAGFCEAARPGWLAQPANALSNLGFVVAGLLIGWHARTTGGQLAMPGLAASYAVVVVLLGPGSMAMHATQTAAGGHLDMTSMFLVAAFAAAYSLARMGKHDTRWFAAVFLGLVLVCEAVDQVPGSLPVLMHWGNVAFGALLLVALGVEWRLRRTTTADGDLRWIAGSVGALLLGFAIWNLAKDGGPWCRPHSLLQGHAAWHLLCALAAYLLYRYWQSDAQVG